MYEYSNQWTLVGGDGTTVQLNDGSSGLIVEDISGFDSPSIRTNVEDLPEADGAAFGDFWYGRRVVTLTGHAAGVAAGTRNAAIASLQRALRGLRSDVTLKTTPTGMPAMQLAGRVSGFRVTGGFAKQFLIELMCADPRIYAQTPSTASVTAATGSPGATFPWVFPVNFGGTTGATAEVSCTNAGNFETPPTITITGPVSNPQVSNATSGESFYLDNVTLDPGETATIDMAARTVVRSSGVSLYGYVRYPGSAWWMLRPGANTIRLWGGGSDPASTQLALSWRSAWC